MNALLVQAPGTAQFNPEAMINAAVAAKAAELAASQAFYASIAIIGILLIIGLIMMFIAYKFDQVQHNTNGMHKKIVELVSKMSMEEGIVLGRGQLQKEIDDRINAVVSEKIQRITVSEVKSTETKEK